MYATVVGGFMNSCLVVVVVIYRVARSRQDRCISFSLSLSGSQYLSLSLSLGLCDIHRDTKPHAIWCLCGMTLCWRLLDNVKSQVYMSLSLSPFTIYIQGIGILSLRVSYQKLKSNFTCWNLLNASRARPAPAREYRWENFPLFFFFLFLLKNIK